MLKIHFSEYFWNWLNVYNERAADWNDCLTDLNLLLENQKFSYCCIGWVVIKMEEM